MVSCTSEENAEDLITYKNNNFQKTTKILLSPENTSNPYDSVGRLHNEVLEIYLATKSDSISTEDIMAQVQAIACSSTINIVQDCGSLFAYDAINTIVANPQNGATTIIENSVLSSQGKANLTAFMNSLLTITTEPYEDNYEFIILYESGILASTLLNSEDKRIILTTSSIVRYSIYYEKKKDRDWDSSVGNFIGGIVGTLNSSLSPVTMALVTGIRYNYSIVNR